MKKNRLSTGFWQYSWLICSCRRAANVTDVPTATGHIMRLTIPLPEGI